MNKTPLCDALRSLAGAHPLRMHMPGHKGKFLPMPELGHIAALDFTELTPTGDLFEGGGPIGAAEALWAEAFHMAHCLFLTGGSTQGVHAALTLTCSPGDTVLLDRSSHRSAYNALALLGLQPIYLERPWLERPGVSGQVVPNNVDNLLKQHPDCKTVCITSPSYYGVLSDVSAIAHIVHGNGGKLVVDAAHGAHLPFLGNFDLSEADVVVVSAHKTLPALGQSALLLTNGVFSAEELRRAAALYGSSSPSYPMMASLDAARAYLEGEGGARYRLTTWWTENLRKRFPSLSGQDAPLDPGRLVLLTPDGFGAKASLEALGVFVEMADKGHIVCILTCADGEEDLLRLEQCLASLALWGAPGISSAAPPLPEQVISPRSAYFSSRERVPLRQALGRISAGQVAPYPPGIPVLAPGERIDKKTIAYLDQIGYNMEEEIEAVRF